MIQYKYKYNIGKDMVQWTNVLKKPGGFISVNGNEGTKTK